MLPGHTPHKLRPRLIGIGRCRRTGINQCLPPFINDLAFVPIGTTDKLIPMTDEGLRGGLIECERIRIGSRFRRGGGL